MKREAKSRTVALLGDDAVNRLENARVAVVGLGGVGGHVLETLARAGVGSFVLVDGDNVEESNLNRQIIATVDTLGKSKAEAAKGRVLSINPLADVDAVTQRLTAANADSILSGNTDYIADCIDSLPDKVALVCFAEKKGKFKSVLVVGILFFVVAYLLMLSQNLWVFVAGILVFFVGFSVHEPIMQSLASRYCKAHQKGSALGVFTAFGYFGSFVGALVGGHLYEYFGMLSISLFVVVVSFLWILALGFLANPTFQKNLYLPLRENIVNEDLEKLVELRGILEWFINENERVVVIKYDKHLVLEQEVKEFLKENLADKFEELK